MARTKIDAYEGPAGGWGSVRSLARTLTRDRSMPRALPILNRQNKPGGVACVSCAWAKPGHPHLFEFCENGAKATSWESTSRRLPAAFFAEHDVDGLRQWTDHALESQGRLTEPMRWDAAQRRYVPVDWETALRDIGERLQALPPPATVFYTSGRASLETSYMYQLLARLYGNNNLPDSSNMCHESTSVALPPTLGVSVGTVHIEDFARADCLLVFGQNTGSNSPRMLHLLQEASNRGVPIITFNPLHERGLERFKNPQAPLEMLRPGATRISSHYHQVKLGGDIAAIAGLCKALLELDDQARAQGQPAVIDHAFVAEHTQGYEAYAAQLRAYAWSELERHSGLTRAAMQASAAVYARARAAIGLYGMGLTQHHGGVDNVQMLVNLLLMRGNMGKPGAGICPVRGHSNVQGQRTVGITEKPELAPLDRLAELYRFEPPREKGLDTVATCEGVLDGSVRAIVSLGGNLLRAAPDTPRLEAVWPKLALTVHITTTLNRSHLFPGQASYLLPCLGRTEIDRQASGPQIVSTEDSTSRIHASHGVVEPAGPLLRSEPAIVAGLAKAIPRVAAAAVPWDEWVADYGRIRDAIEATYPDRFPRYNERLGEPGGFPLPNAARERRWETETGRANFTVPERLTAVAPDGIGEGAQPVLQLMTIRSNDQFNTTVYDYNDRFRGIYGTRHVVLMNRDDMARLGLAAGQDVALETTLQDGHRREMRGLRATPYDIPPGCCAAYYPECNGLIPVWHHARGSHVPAAKSIPVRVSVL